MNIFSDISKLERNLWIELLVDAIVAVYYFPKMFLLLKAGDQAGHPIASLMVKTIILAIVLTIVLHIVIAILTSIFSSSSGGKVVSKSGHLLYDERDNQFSRNGVLVAHWVLNVFICLIMGQVAISVMFPELAESRGIPLTPIIIAHLLLVSLILSSSIKSVVQIFYYRRGY